MYKIRFASRILGKGRVKEKLKKREEAGILRDKTMDDKLIYIPNYDKQITFGHCYFVPTNQELIKVSKVLKPTNVRTVFISWRFV